MRDLAEMFENNSGMSIIDDTESHQLERDEAVADTLVKEIASKSIIETGGQDPMKGYKSIRLHTDDKWTFPIKSYYQDITIDGVLYENVKIDVYFTAEHKYNRMPVKYRVHGGFDINEIN